jgi:hypothetical protein
MNKNKLIKIKAHRILNELRNFEGLGQEVEQKIKLENGEEIVGVYRNYPQTDSEAIVVTTSGLHYLVGNSVSIIKYSEIANIKSPQAKEAGRLFIVLKNGEMKALPILGGEGQFHDIFPFLRFLDRVISAIS